MRHTSRTLLLLVFLTGTTFTLSAQIQGTFPFEGTDRSYLVYLPADYLPGDSRPLLFALHGLTQNGNLMMQFTGFNDYADQYGFIVVYPDGISNSWNVGIPGGSSANDVGFLSALIDTLHQRYNINLNRVYSTGFSNGGFMSYRLACELGDRIAAIAPVAGTMTEGSYNACQPTRSFPVMHIHGTNDLIVFYNGGFGNKSVDEVMTLWKNNGNCPSSAVIVNLPDLVPEGSTVQTHTWSPCDDSASVVLYRIINGGHTWPGELSNSGVGNVNRDISASDEIWKFVSRFSLDITTGTNPGPVSEAKIYPNPNDGKRINLEFGTLRSRATLEIFNAQGSVIHREIIGQGSNQHSISVFHFPRGLLLIRLFNTDINFTSKLLIP